MDNNEQDNINQENTPENNQETPPEARSGNAQGNPGENNESSGLGLSEFGEPENASHHDDEFRSFDGGGYGNGGHPGEMNAVYNVPVQVSAVLGKAVMPVSQLLKLGRGAVVELDRRVGEAIEIYVNNRLIARGEVVVVDDRLGITMTEIIKAER